MSVSKSIGKATMWSFAAEIAAKLITPITNIILARILAPEAFGIIATINMVVSLADTFSTAGFQKYVIQHDFSNKEELSKSATVAFWTNLGVTFIAWAIITIFSTPITIRIGNPGYETALVVAALALPLTGLSSIHEALFQRELDYKTLFIRRLVVSLLPFLVTIPLALLGFDYWSIIIGSLVGCVVKAALLAWKSTWRPRFYYSIKCLYEMFSFSAWTFFESLALWASTYIDILIISNALGNYYTGLYRNSQILVSSILSVITGATTSVLFSSLSRCQDHDTEFKRVFFTFQKYTAVFVLPLGVLLFTLRDTVTAILLGSQWMEASFFIGIWGLCTSLVCVFGTYCREVYRAKGSPKTSLVAQLFHLVFIIPICYYFVRLGFHALSIARSLAYLQIILVHFIIVYYKYRLSAVDMMKAVKEPLLFSVLIGIMSFIAVSTMDSTIVNGVLIGIVSVILYFGALLLIPPYRKDAQMLLNKISKKHND